jgi:polyhydroxyalkanoate synthesis regulator phasin
MTTTQPAPSTNSSIWNNASEKNSETHRADFTWHTEDPEGQASYIQATEMTARTEGANQPTIDPIENAFGDLAAALSAIRAATAQKEAALETIKALVDAGKVRSEEGKENSFQAEGVRVSKTIRTKWVQSTKAKENLAELLADLKKVGEVTETQAEQWNTKLL